MSTTGGVEGIASPASGPMATDDHSPADAFAVCDAYLDRRAAMMPVLATFWGVPGHDDRWSDLSPAGWEEARAFAAGTLAQADAAVAANHRERVALDVLRERVRIELDSIDSGDAQLGLSTYNGHHTAMRDIFEFMPADGDGALATIARRLETIPEALARHRDTLRDLAGRGVVALSSQALSCAEQCLAWSRPSGPFAAMGMREERIAKPAVIAMAGFLEHGTWLRDDYAPLASDSVGIGRERYALSVRYACGVELDLDETYAWGWAELQSISDRMDRLVERIAPGSSRRECMDLLDRDPRYSVPDATAFVRWSEQTVAATLDALDGSVFDIPAPLRRCDSMPIPSDLAADTYYTAPSEDLSRPGMVWHPIEGREHFPVWSSLSTLYHEGVPGHHLQLGQVRLLADRLTRFQRLDVYIPAHGEGWALYAERLMRELGYFEDPAYELGWLVNQALRAVRVVVDIGLHCGMRIPEDAAFHPGEPWTAELAVEFLRFHTAYSEPMARGEIRRYIGMPAQAISYKVGERVWMEARQTARRRLGAHFDLRAFHTLALDLGPMGLDMLAAEFERFAGRSSGSAGQGH